MLAPRQQRLGRGAMPDVARHISRDVIFEGGEGKDDDDPLALRLQFRQLPDERGRHERQYSVGVAELAAFAVDDAEIIGRRSQVLVGVEIRPEAADHHSVDVGSRGTLEDGFVEVAAIGARHIALDPDDRQAATGGRHEGLAGWLLSAQQGDEEPEEEGHHRHGEIAPKQRLHPESGADRAVGDSPRHAETRPGNFSGRTADRPNRRWRAHSRGGRRATPRTVEPFRQPVAPEGTRRRAPRARRPRRKPPGTRSLGFSASASCGSVAR